MSGLPIESQPENVLPPENAPRYDLDPAEQRALVDELLTEEEFVGTNKRFVCAVVPSDSKYANLGRTLERDVFEKYFNNDNKTMEDEYGKHEADSLFCLVVDSKSRTPAGVIRILKHTPEHGLKSLNDAEKLLNVAPEELTEHHQLDDLGNCWDIATMAVAKRHIGKLSGDFIKIMLFRTFFNVGRQQDFKHVVTIIDSHAKKGALEVGIPLVPLAGREDPIDYLGSEQSYAMYGDFTTFEQEVTARMLELRQRARLTPANIRHNKANPLRLVQRRVFARYVGDLVSGRGLDSRISIKLPES